LFVPEHYRERGATELFEAMRAHAFATIVSAGTDGAPAATWIPFVVEGEPKRPVIYGHLARANPQWTTWHPATPLLALFQGPHHYVSPSWYASSPNVPTWNYLAVQVRGRPRVLEDPREVEAMLERLVAQFEADREPAWELRDEPSDYRERMARGIVAFELLIDEIAGAFKLSQSKSAADRAGAIAGLERCAGDDAEAIAQLMRR
jgi:transcriptional regulator